MKSWQNLKQKFLMKALLASVLITVSSFIVFLVALGLPAKLKMVTISHYDDLIADIFSQFPRNMGLDAPINPSSPARKIFLVGDSLIELSFDPFNSFPFGSALAHAFRRRADVLNRGLSGYSSKWMDSQISKVIREIIQLKEDEQVFMLVVLIGTNDSVLSGNPHHVPLHDYKLNLQRVVKALNSACPGAALLLVTPPPCSLEMINGPSSKLSKSGRSRSNAETAKYAQVVREVVKSYDEDLDLIRLLDLQEKILQDSSRVEDFLSDGVHLNGNGYKALFLLVFAALDSLKDRLPYLPLTEPHFSVQIKQQEEKGHAE